jgi:hypothetical protein
MKRSKLAEEQIALPKMTEEQKRALEEAVKRAIEDWLKNKSTQA